jgi:hypothetical protein
MSAQNFKISVRDAVEYTTTWRTIYSSDPSIPMAFTICHQEILDIIAEVLPPGTDPQDIAYRFYMGYKQTEVVTPRGTEIQTKPAMVIVVVTGFTRDEQGNVTNPGTDLYEIVKTVKGDDLTDTDTSGCFDFAYPCPATCQLNSPLIDGFIPA